MSGKYKTPVTPAIRLLREKGVKFTEHLYRYEPHGGTKVSARELAVEEHRVIKTLVMEDEQKRPLLVLMHGDLEVSTKQLARQMKVKMVTPCEEHTATRHTGYLFGGTSPFGTIKKLPVYMEETILALETIYINGGKRGFLVEIKPAEIVRLLEPIMVQVGVKA